MTGDFNATPDAPEIKVFTEHGMGIVDATANLGGTFHNFGRRETFSKIDYIFTNGVCDLNESFVVPDEGVDGVYISDHFPVCALIEME
jgi:endonuclease/exonuclease/phosphatase family metal-dependent hydrolase